MLFQPNAYHGKGNADEGFIWINLYVSGIWWLNACLIGSPFKNGKFLKSGGRLSVKP